MSDSNAQNALNPFNLPSDAVPHIHDCSVCNRSYIHFHVINVNTPHTSYVGECAYPDCTNHLNTRPMGFGPSIAISGLVRETIAATQCFKIISNWVLLSGKQPLWLCAIVNTRCEQPLTTAMIMRNNQYLFSCMSYSVAWAYFYNSIGNARYYYI